MRSLGPAVKVSVEEIRRELALGEGPGLERSALVEKIYALAEIRAGRKLARAALPRIDLKSPKFTRKLTTEWFAKRVNERFQRCRAVKPEATL